MALRLFLIYTLLFIACCLQTQAQSVNGRIESIRGRLENVTDDIPQLNNKVSFSISGASLYEFLRALAVKNKLNLSIDPSLDNSIAVNFTNVTVTELMVYLSEQYNLEVFINGSIISVVKYIAPIAETPLKPISVQYDKERNLISYDLRNDSLGSVLKKITSLSNANVIAPQRLHQNLVSGFVKDLSIEKGVSELAYMNNLSFQKKDSLTYYIEEINARAAEREKSINASLPKGLSLLTNKSDSIISIQAVNQPIKEVLAAVARELNINYFLFTEIQGNSDLKLDYIDFNTFLKYLFNTTSYTYKIDNGIYLIGDRKQEEIRTAEVYPLQYRTVTNLVEQIPSDMKKSLEIIALKEMNSLVIAGSAPAVKELKGFLRLVDKIVPVVNIELIILDVRKSSAISTGIMAGIDNQKSTSYSSLFPSLDVTLSSNSINNIIDGINGTGLVNLGKVTPGFYVSLKASEDNGYLKIRSTPKLATLNGNEAKMSIGETRYYAEQTTNVITTQSTTTVTGRIFKELQANFGITIKPIVSGDEQITLDITVEQSTFTEQFTKDGPYGRLTRSFQSSLRVKNNDMILLGGLEEKSNDDAGQGVPILSRIPVVKWLFSSRSRSSKKSKLAILIHPTVFY
ncbi:MAG: hypothetical protein EOP56_18855 [Sphingobacteriales bacterium]|nr:MAG: hypothetical protein EOP56_18855 [Sphingobacteriales bacterium]